MSAIDVFNGDADGLCALRQWRLAFPEAAQRVTGVKRDIQLLARVKAGAGDRVTVFDISFDSNRADAQRLLTDGAELVWFDHHYAGELPVHPAFTATIDPAPLVCTSLLVDRVLGGRFRAWAVVGAFGDNLAEAATEAAAPLALAAGDLQALAQLGELLNYNGYGDSLEDLHFPPEALYSLLTEYAEPLDFVRQAPAFGRLKAGFDEDMAACAGLQPALETPRAAAYLLPDAAWARRAVGVLANRLASSARDRAHALLVPDGRGTLTVSVRAAKNQPTGAEVLCRRFPGGGGRQAAAGINRLPMSDAERFIGEFAGFFAG
jgi:hypothetical protein